MALQNRSAKPVPVEKATRLPRVGDLEVDVHERFQSRDWAVQRVGWVAIALLLVVSALGLLGGYGPLNDLTLRTEGLTVEADRVTRHGGKAKLSVEVAQAAVRDDTFEIWVDREWWQGMSLRSDPIPEPDSMRVSGDVVVFTFSADPGSGTQRVEFLLEPDSMGRRPARVGIVGGGSVSFRQLVLP